LSINTIVAALALETDNDPVAGRALQLARQHEARLIFVHAVEDRPPGGDLPVSLDVSALHAMVERNAADRIRQLTGNPGSEAAVEIVVETGKPYQVIDEIVQRGGADLIVIGPGKAKNMREKVFGSTADRVVRTARQPILVVRSSVANPYRHIAVAADFSAASRAAAKAALRLAPDAAIELVHAIETPLAFEQAMQRAGTSQKEIDRYRRARASEARRQISASLEEHDLPLVRAKLRIVDGDAGRALVRFTRRGRTDLIALGTHGGNALSQMVLGSVARHVLRAAGCDVLVSA
jgi:nucleotide-binding universal stress UspA family protein